MRLLFLTNYNCPITGEHIFTKGVWSSLCEKFEQKDDDIILGTIYYIDDTYESYVIEDVFNGVMYYKFYCSSLLNEEEIITEISKLFSIIKPSVIHANMTKRYEIVAAQNSNIPIILTIHIGGFVCPRGGLHGLMNYKDCICDTKVGPQCLKCCSKDLPLPALTNLLYRITPNRLLSWAYKKVGNKHIFYITQFLNYHNDLVQRIKDIEIYKNTTIIAANYRLKEILALNGLTENVYLLPHGVEFRPKLPLPEMNVVKFFYFGRIQYAKGLHNLLRAFEGINDSLYELHVIGEIANIGKSKKYMTQLLRSAKDKSVIFHRTVAHEDLEKVIKDMHVMIHPAICLEVYGLTIAESLSMGRPVLATCCGGAEVQVIDGVNGWLVPANDVEVLHNKILHIIQHKEEIVSMSNNCRLPHPLPEYAENITHIYTRLVK